MTTGRTGVGAELDPARVEPETSRVVVVDVQNDFLADGGWFDNHGEDLQPMRAAVANIQEFLPLARKAGVRPVFVRAIYDRIWLSEPMLERHKRTGLDVTHCQEGTWGAEFYEVRPEPEDFIVTKHRYSAFIGTSLDTYLKAQGVKNLIFTGVTSNVCVESTARDAYMLDYHVVVVSDASASYNEEVHEATLTNMRRAFGTVVTRDEIIDAWRRSGALASAGAA
jgi:ureidoacrylate peracid hydrolase